MKDYHRIVAKRYHKDGVLIFNDGDDIAGQSQGMLKSLDLNQDTYIGSVPTNYTRLVEHVTENNTNLSKEFHIKLSGQRKHIPSTGKFPIKSKTISGRRNLSKTLSKLKNVSIVLVDT